MAIALLAILAIDLWLGLKYLRYGREVDRLRAGMSNAERERTDLVLASETNRLKVTLELFRLQAQGDRDLHLAVAVDSGVMHLEREGARLRDMTVAVAPERWVAAAGGDSIRMTPPRGQRTIQKILGPDDPWTVPEWVYALGRASPEGSREVRGALGPTAILLDGGTVIYTPPKAGPLADTSYVLPGAIRANPTDLAAIAPNLRPGMVVYFY